MAGTRLLLSGVVLVELLALAAWSFWHGMCWKNDDRLCHFLEGNKVLPRPLRPLPLPAWWTTTLSIHLVVEQPQSLAKWSGRLQSWAESSKLEEWPYFGSTELYMQVIPGQQHWSKTERLTSQETDALWDSLPSTNSIDTMKSAGKFLDWILYIPSSSLISNTTEEGEEEYSWSSWIRNEQQMLTVLLQADGTAEQQNWSHLKSLIGPWLDSLSKLDNQSGDQSENDYMRKLQLAWHRTIAEDLQVWKSYLTQEEHSLALSLLGKVSNSFLDRLQYLQQARLLLEAAVERQDTSLAPEFPPEHYAAVFFPLLFPLIVPFLAAFIKESKRYKKKKKEERNAITVPKNTGAAETPASEKEDPSIAD